MPNQRKYQRREIAIPPELYEKAKAHGKRLGHLSFSETAIAAFESWVNSQNKQATDQETAL